MSCTAKERSIRVFPSTVTVAASVRYITACSVHGLPPQVANNLGTG
jgi:hypothetical protein